MDNNIQYTEEQLLNFTKFVWYNKPLNDYSKGLTDYLQEWKDMGCNYVVKEDVKIKLEILSNENKVDVKYIGIPNICFSLSTEDDKREPKYSEQRKTRGFDDSETWSLSDTIANFIIPRLERFNEVNNGFPHNLTMRKWRNKIKLMITAFKLIARDEGMRIYNKKEEKQIDMGLDAFREYFMHLWW